ncbi:acyl-CoA dehydrogenase [Archaeoglobales archaeon]|nr:MAG: acyl-CoA dehydrogenase [Archaeoglobales archaeon]
MKGGEIIPLEELNLPFLSEEHRLLRSAIREFAEKEIIPTALERDKNSDIQGTVKIFKKLAKLGYAGIRIPEEYGGQGMDMYSEIILMEELGYADPSVAVTMLIHTGAAAACIYQLAPEELKQRYLPTIAKGEKILAFAMTEDEIPGSWSSYMKTTAKLEGDKYILNGRKAFITNAGIADLFVVFARLDQEKPDHKGIGIFLVEKEFPGVSFESEEPALGIKAASWGTVSFNNCEVPKENLIMEPPKAFAAAMNLFNQERMENPSVCNGIATRALDESVGFLSQRKDPRSGKSFIEGYQSLQFKIAEMYALIRASRLGVWHAAYLLENGHPYVKEVSAAKFFANEAVRKVCSDAVQLHGGYGYSAALIVEKLLRDGMFGGIAGGTLEALKLRTIREILREKGISRK